MRFLWSSQREQLMKYPVILATSCLKLPRLAPSAAGSVSECTSLTAYQATPPWLLDVTASLVGQQLSTWQQGIGPRSRVREKTSEYFLDNPSFISLLGCGGRAANNKRVGNLA